MQQTPPNFQQRLDRASALIAEKRMAAAERELHAALQLQPDSLDARVNLSGIYLQAGKLNEAETWCRKALEVAPHDTRAHFNLGLCLRMFERTTEAIEHFEYVCLLAPAHQAASLELALLRLNICDWSRRDRDIETIRSYFLHTIESGELGVDRLWTLNQIPQDPALQARAARAAAEGVAGRVDDLRERCNFVHVPTETARLKIGYVSPDFRRHAVGSLIHGMFGHHDRERFEVYAYSLQHSDDPFFHEVQRDCEHFAEVDAEDPETLARRIHADGIQILVDLGGYTTFTKPETFALQPAPVQVQYLGFLNTMGAPYYQYTLGDPTVMTDDLAEHYSERIAYVPESFMVTSGFPIDSGALSRADAGLPEDAVVYCSFNSPYKLDPEVFDSWARILRAVERSVLWLYISENELAERNIRIEARQRGIDNDRIIFAERMDLPKHLARIALADLFLDTYLYNAGATAAGALYAGLPMLTRYGTTVLSRMGASMLKAVGLDELICRDTQSYEQKAIQLGQDPEQLRAIRERLRLGRDSAPLFDTGGFVLGLEGAYERMWANALAGCHEDIRI